MWYEKQAAYLLKSDPGLEKVELPKLAAQATQDKAATTEALVIMTMRPKTTVKLINLRVPRTRSMVPRCHVPTQTPSATLGQMTILWSSRRVRSNRVMPKHHLSKPTLSTVAYAVIQMHTNGTVNIHPQLFSLGPNLDSGMLAMGHTALGRRPNLGTPGSTLLVTYIIRCSDQPVHHAGPTTTAYCHPVSISYNVGLQFYVNNKQTKLQERLPWH